VPLGVFLYRTARSAAGRFSGAAVVSAILMGVALTQSRGGFVALALMGITMVLVRWIRPVHFLSAFLALVLVLPLISPDLLSRATSIVNARHILDSNKADQQQADGAIRGRTTAMLVALSVFLDHPVLGVGPGQFTPFYFLDYARKADLKFRDIQVPRRAHNLYLEMSAELGLVGLAGFLSIIGMLMGRLWVVRARCRTLDPEAADLATALWIALLAYLATGVFLHMAYQRYYWFLLALAGAALQLVPRSAWQPGPPAVREPTRLGLSRPVPPRGMREATR